MTSALFRLAYLYLLIGISIVLPAAEKGNLELSKERMSLKAALIEISNQTNLSFVYGDHLIAGIEVFRVGKYQDADTMLMNLLRQTGLGFEKRENRRVLFPDAAVERITLSGYVIHSEGPLRDVAVSLSDSFRTLRTDSSGFFSFPSVPNSLQKLWFQSRDFISAEHEWKPGDTRQLIVILEKQPFVSEHIRVARVLDEMVGLSPIEKLTVNADQLIAQNAVARDLFQGLEAISGVETGIGETGVSVRGARPSENLVLLDGIKLYQIDHAMGHFSALNPDAIGQVALYKGSYPANYGNRLAGVLDVSTRKPHSDRLEGTLGVDRDMAHLSVKTPITPYAHAMVALRDAISDDTAISVSDRIFSTTFNEELETFDEVDYIESTREFDFEDQLAHISVSPREDTFIEATYFRGRDASVDNLSYLASQFSESAVDEFFNRNGIWGNDGTSLRWQHYWNPNWSSEVRVSQSKFRTNFADEELYNVFVQSSETIEQRRWDYALNTEIKESGFQAQVKYDWIGGNTLEIGAFYETIDLNWFETLVNEYEDEVKLETALKGGFAQYQWHSSKGFHVLFGLRAGQNTLTEENYTEPRIAFRYDLNDYWRLSTSYGRFHQFILRTPDTASYFSGVPSWFLPEEDGLEAGESENFQIGAVYQRGPWKFDIEPYYKRQEGSLAKLVEPLRFYYELFQLSEVYRGVDTQLSWQQNNLTAKTAYSYRYSRVVGNDTTGEAQDYPTDRDRPHVFDASLLWQLKSWDVWTGFHWQAGVPYTTPDVLSEDLGDYVIRELVEPERRNTKRLPDTSELDLRVGYRFKLGKIRAHVSGRVENVFNSSNPIYRFFYIENQLEREGAKLVPIDVNDFGRRISMELRLAF